MESEFDWDLSSLYENDEQIENDIRVLYDYLSKMREFKGKLNNSVDEVFNCYKNLEKALEIHERLYGYAMLKYNQNMSNQDSIKLFKRMETITAEFSEAESFISPELSKISDERLEEYLQDERMKEYEKSIRDIIKEKKHILSEDVEEALAKYTEVFSATENIYDIFTDTEFDYPSIYDDEGNELKMNSALFSQYLMSKSENIRKQAFESMYSLYKKHINTITELYLTRVKTRTISSKIRNYESSLDAATNHDDSNVGVYKKLVEEVNKNLYLNHEYLKLKAKLLGKEKVNMYDVYVNTLDLEDKKIEYKDAQNTVLDALSCMGEEYISMLKTAFNNRWLDVYKKENKRSGAYSMGIHTVHPFVLLNYINSSRDVSTIAHELGHSMHSYYSSKNQNIINASYTIMVAEVASTVNEIILANYLIGKEQDKTKKAALINEQLDMIRATLIRQTMFAEFEEIVHSKVEAGESLSSDNLNDIYYEIVKKYFGDITNVNEEIKYEWARIPHFYSCFYVYKYATGITSAIVIASKILAGEEGYVERYINMLSKGGSIDSLSLLRSVDVDLEKDETYEEAFRYFEKLLRELESLVD